MARLKAFAPLDFERRSRQIGGVDRQIPVQQKVQRPGGIGRVGKLDAVGHLEPVLGGLDRGPDVMVDDGPVLGAPRRGRGLGGENTNDQEQTEASRKILFHNMPISLFGV